MPLRSLWNLSSNLVVYLEHVFVVLPAFWMQKVDNRLQDREKPQKV